MGVVQADAKAATATSWRFMGAKVHRFTTRDDHRWWWRCTIARFGCAFERCGTFLYAIRTGELTEI